ncbi:MAG: amidohydrolase family protein [Armatimonadota bacterium]
MSDFDLIIAGATIVDGTGRRGFEGDIGVVRGTIAGVGDLERAQAGQIIEAGGLTVIPGIVDCHAHSDLTLLADPRGQSKLHQGVTTELNGQCGLGVFPVRPERQEELGTAVSFITAPVQWTWESAEQYLATLDRAPPAYWAATMVAHGALRAYAMGFQSREPTDAELALMCDALRASLDAGCFGLSLGFAYAPGYYAREAEVLALLRVVAERGRLVSVHPRTEGTDLCPAISEVAELCRRANDGVRGPGLRLQIDHLKRSGSRAWGTMDEPIALIEGLRAGGLDVAFDVYPYVAGSRHLSGSLPSWVHDGGATRMLERIGQPQTRARLRAELAAFDAGESTQNPFELDFDRIMVTDVRTEANRAVIGQRITQIAAERGVDPLDACLDLLIEEGGHVSGVFFSMTEDDMRQALVHPLGAVATDGMAFAPEGPARLGNPHPRCYGTYPRLFGRYVREHKLLTLEEAVRKCTSWPASRLGLSDRGRIRRGMRADLVIFDSKRIIDTATWEEPHQFPRGIEFVLVGGHIAVEAGRQNTERYGGALRA